MTVEKAEQYLQNTVDKGALAAVIDRIVDVAAPDKIILFGSAARGQSSPNSDLDLLVIKSGCSHRGQLVERIYERLLGLRQAVDVIVVTPEDIERYRDASCLVLNPALQEGKIVYERESVPTG